MVLGYHEGSQGTQQEQQEKETGASGSVPEHCAVEDASESEWRSELC